MAADPGVIKAVEAECPFCGAKIDKGFRLQVYLCGTEVESQIRTTTCWSREARALRSFLREVVLAIEELGRAANPHTYYNNCQKVEAINLSLKIKHQIVDTLQMKNPADDPDNCLACMGATGFSVRHTCKPK